MHNFTNKFCQCSHEIENNLPRTKFCFMPCHAQRGESRTELKESLQTKEKLLAHKDKNNLWPTSSERQDFVQEIIDLQEKLNPTD